jgi:purine-nucleoside phosphorylase
MEQKVGDVIIGEKILPMNAAVFERNGSQRFSGVRWSMRDDATMFWESDPTLVKLAQVAATKAAGLVAGPASSVEVGIIGSSDYWRQSPELIAEAAATGSLCEEMEAHAVAQICSKFGVRFVAIKDIANSEIIPDVAQVTPKLTALCCCHANNMCFVLLKLAPADKDVPDGVKVGHRAANATIELLRMVCGA